MRCLKLLKPIRIKTSDNLLVPVNVSENSYREKIYEFTTINPKTKKINGANIKIEEKELYDIVLNVELREYSKYNIGDEIYHFKDKDDKIMKEKIYKIEFGFLGLSFNRSLSLVNLIDFNKESPESLEEFFKIKYNNLEYGYNDYSKIDIDIKNIKRKLLTYKMMEL